MSVTRHHLPDGLQLPQAGLDAADMGQMVQAHIDALHVSLRQLASTAESYLRAADERAWSTTPGLQANRRALDHAIAVAKNMGRGA